MRLSKMLALFVFAASGSAVLAQEKVENPVYTSWAKWKVGTTVVHNMWAGADKPLPDIVFTSKLIEVTDEKVVVELTSKSGLGGFAPAKEEHPKRIELPKDVTKEDFAAGRPPGTTKEGTETLKINGKEIKTKWFEHEKEVAGTKVKVITKVWNSAEVPGILVKSVEKNTTPDAVETKTELVEFKKP